jgi:membrane-bound serine protease (ClpP class)
MLRLKSSPRRFLAFLALTLGIGALLFGAVADAETVAADLAPVDVVEVSGLIDPINVDAIETAIERSATNGAQALILQVNTKGSVVPRARMARLIEKIASAEIPIAIWVGPSGSKLLGLPAQMLAAADVTAMAPGSKIGRTGLPLNVDGVEIDFGAATDVLVDGTLGFREARSLGALKLTTDDEGVPVLRNMLYALDGQDFNGTVLDTVIESTDEDGQIVRDAAPVRFFKTGLWARLFHTVASPASAYLLFVIGVSLLIFEFFTAGIGVAGLVGAACASLSAYGLGALPLRGWSLILMLFAFFGFAVDVQVGVPRFWTRVSLVLFAVASWYLFRPVDGLTMRPSWITLSVGIIGVALTFIVGMPSMVRTRFATPTIGREWMVGMTGQAVNEVNPEGVVLVSDARWRARTNRATPITAGSTVRVVAIDGVTLEVEPEEGAARDYRERRDK